MEGQDTAHPEIPAQVPGMPESGLQVDLFGNYRTYTPSPRYGYTQASLDDQVRLHVWNASAKGDR